jgi:hypothetical protein
MSLIFGACSHSPGRLVAPKTEDGKPKVAISDACEKLAKRVPAPAIKKGDNAKALAAKALGSLKTANHRLTATAACQRKQREDFAKGG